VQTAGAVSKWIICCMAKLSVFMASSPAHQPQKRKLSERRFMSKAGFTAARVDTSNPDSNQV